MELLTEWQRSSRCNTGACVEVAALTDGIAVRDSKNLEQPALFFSRDDWHRFLDQITADTSA